MKFKRIATGLLQHIDMGNIKNVTHCSTRLRINVTDIGKIDTESIKKVDGVLGVVKQGNTLQIIFGPEVEQVYTAFMELHNNAEKIVF